MKRRLLAIFLSLTLMLSLVPSAWAVENEESSQETVVEEPETELIEGLQARINALPDAAALAEMDEDALKAVYNEVQTIYDALDALSTEEVEALELTPLETAAAFFTEQVAPLDVSAGIVVSENATWNTATTLTKNLIVNSGVTLTIGAQVTISGNVTVSGGGTIKRADEYNAEIFNVSTGNSLTLNGVVLDGGAVYGQYDPETVANKPNEEAKKAMKEFLDFDYENNTGKKDAGLLIDVAGGSLVMRNNTVLQNNATSVSARDNYYNDYPEKRTCAGVGIRAGGIFTMEGGQISRMVGPSVLVNDLESKFIMSGGEISNSQGNAVLCYGEMKMTAGSISRHTNTNNTAVGLRGDNASFYMDGGEISNNFGVGGNYGTIMATSGADQKIDLLGGQIHDNRGTYGTALVTFGTPNVHIGGNCKIHHNAPGTGANSDCVWIAGAGGTLLIDGNAEISNNTASPTLLIDCTATLAGDAKIENNTWTGRNGYAVNVRAGSATIKDQFSISNNIGIQSSCSEQRQHFAEYLAEGTLSVSRSRCSSFANITVRVRSVSLKAMVILRCEDVKNKAPSEITVWNISSMHIACAQSWI